jgi:GNAT superfamily N-acetyltransferase
MRAFPEFFLSLLGPRFLEEFYRAVISDPNGIALVAVAEDTRGVLGLVVGVLEPSRFYRTLALRRGWAFGLAALPALCRRPSILGRLARGLVYRGDAPRGSSRALLSSIAVDPQAQGLGIGGGLLRRWADEARGRGAAGGYLTTDADDNAIVNGFYAGAGWRVDETIVTPEGRRLNRYVRDWGAQ